MKKYIYLFTFLLFNACDNPDVDPSTFQEIFFEQQNVNIDLPDVTNEDIDVQVLLNARPNTERLTLVLLGEGDIDGVRENLKVEINVQISNLILNPDFSYSFIIEESTPIKTLVNCDADNPNSAVGELVSFVEGINAFKWNNDNQQYYMDLNDLNDILPQVTLPSQMMYQTAGVIQRDCN
ncbi:hypothetical protein [Flammeovirga aprica]|uniref:Uncharacterized protein n=1 Tax=Flammeovirga aprica JL-4 TaxID=694437 RepID=A0A7X9RZK4_9BACT|nr:hypothetical protein [Flammeovirga aprica]NME71655.1 hypothetical protein [Flammeovirga aprica JL-4]